MDYKELILDVMAGRGLSKVDSGEHAFDSANAESDDYAADFDGRSAAIAAAAAIQQWAEDDDLGDGETVGDRLFALLMGVVDADKDGEVTDEEQEQFDELCDYAAQYLERLGIDSDDIDLLLTEFDDEAAERVRDVVLSNLPDGDDAADDINKFVFGGSEAMDSAAKAGYKTVVVVRDGKKTFAGKRIAGKVRLSAKQKIGLTRARAKSKTAQALRNWRKSMRLRKRMGIKNLSRKA